MRCEDGGTSGGVVGVVGAVGVVVGVVSLGVVDVDVIRGRGKEGGYAFILLFKSRGYTGPPSFLK